MSMFIRYARVDIKDEHEWKKCDVHLAILQGTMR